MTGPRLVATAWSSAGDTSPMLVPATSPVPIAERLAAIADAGFCGLGLIADDLVAIRDSIGFDALRGLISEAGLLHVEIELLERWWIPRGELGHSYDVRDLLFEAADALTPVQIKIGSENGPATSDPLALVAPLRELAEQAATHGTRVAIETMPFSAIATVPMGAEIVLRPGIRRRDCSSTPGMSSEPAPASASCVAALTPEMIFGVELDDAAPDIVGTLFEDTVNNRMFAAKAFRPDRPGGSAARPRVRRARGVWRFSSTSFRALPVNQALKLAAESTLTVL